MSQTWPPLHEDAGDCDFDNSVVRGTRR